jgi:hypothetical protein
MHRVATKFVPRLLTPEQKEHRVAICQKLRQHAVDDPSFMSRVITVDESWVYGYDPETKQQFSLWKSPGSPRPKEARQSRSAIKSMLVVFFDNRGIVHHEFVPEGQTVNAEFYCNVLRRLKVRSLGTNFAATRCMFKLHVRIVRTVPYDTLTIVAMSLTVLRRSSCTSRRLVSTFLGVALVEGGPDLSSSASDVLPLLKWACHSKHLA